MAEQIGKNAANHFTEVEMWEVHGRKYFSEVGRVGLVSFVEI
jgi:hypothetical protein